MSPVFVSAGCTRRPHVSAIHGGRIVYASRSNLIFADGDQIQEVRCLENEITAIASGDELLLAGDRAGTVHYFGAYTGRWAMDSSIEALGLFDGRRAVVCTLGEMHLLNLEERRIEKTVPNDWFPTCTAALDEAIVVGTQTGELLYFNGDLKMVRRHKAHSDSIRTMEPYMRKYMATASQDETIKVWEYGEPRLIQTLNGHTDWIYGLAWTEDGDLVSASADCSIIHWARRNGWENAMRLGGHKPFFNALRYNGSTIGQSYSGGFYKFDEELTDYISGHLDEIRSIDWRGEFILTSSFDMTSRIFLRGREVGRAQNHGHPLTAARFLDKHSLRLISSAQETILRLCEPTQLFYMCCISIENRGRIEGLCISSERTGQGRSICDYFGDLEELKPCAVPAELSLTNQATEDMDFESLNEHLLSTTAFNETQKLYGHYFEINDVAVSERYIVSCNRSLLKRFSGIFVWNKSYELVQYIGEHDYGIERLKFSSDGRYLAAVSRDKTASVYEVSGELRLIRRLTDHKRIVWDCSFSFDSGYLATCSRDKKVFIYSVPDFRVVSSLSFDCEATALCFSTRDGTLAVGLESGELVLIGEKMEEMSRSREHSQRINAIEFNEDGSKFASGGADGMLKVFNAPGPQGG
jgi:elongator complex protein 2